MVRILYLRLLLTLLTGTALCLAVFSPATAAPAPDPESQRITITLTSDRQHNGAAVWFDAAARLRPQTHVPGRTHEVVVGIPGVHETFAGRTTRRAIPVRRKIFQMSDLG